MIDFGEDYIPIQEGSRIFTVQGLETQLTNSLYSIGREFEVSQLRSYRTFIKKAVDPAKYFLKRGITVNACVDNSFKGISVISVDAEFPSKTFQPYIEYYPDQIKPVSIVKDPSSLYVTFVNAIRRDGVLKGRAEKNMIFKLFNEIDLEGCVDGEFLMDPLDIEFARRLAMDFR